MSKNAQRRMQYERSGDKNARGASFKENIQQRSKGNSPLNNAFKVPD